MLDDVESIRIAAQAIAVRTPVMTQPLLQASETLWSRLHGPQGPPVMYLSQAQALSARLAAFGSLEATLDALDETGVNTVARDIIQFADNIHELDAKVAER